MTISQIKNKGFTLVELLFVVILLSILGVSVMKVIFFLEATSSSAEISRRGTETLSNLSVTLRSLLLSRGNSNLSPSKGQSTQNIAGIQRSIIVENSDGGNSEILRFAAIIPASFEPSLNGLSGEKEVKYYVDSNSADKPLIVEIWPIRGKAETPLYKVSILDHVILFKVRQWQGKAWSDNWSNPYGGAPRLLEITVSYEDGLNGPKSTVRFTAPLGANS